jgi:hypothetical protein
MRIDDPLTIMSPETRTSPVLQSEWTPDQLPAAFRLARSRIMYLESKAEGLEGQARIGRVYFSKTGKTLYYRGLQFRSLKGRGFKANYRELISGHEYWISGPRRDRDDRLYGGNRGVKIDDDVRAEYRAYLRGS